MPLIRTKSLCIQLSGAIQEGDSSYVIEQLKSFLDFVKFKCDLLKGMTGAAGMNLNRSMLVGEDLRYGSPAPGPAPVGFPFSPQAMSSPQQQQTRMPYSPYGQQQQFAQSPGAGMMMQHYDAGDLNAEIRYGNRL
jgi:hypothetical protein